MAGRCQHPCQLCLASWSHHGPCFRGTSLLTGLPFGEVHLTFLDTSKCRVLRSGLFTHSGGLERNRSWSLVSLSAYGESCPQLVSPSPHGQGRGPVGRMQLNTELRAV